MRRRAIFAVICVCAVAVSIGFAQGTGQSSSSSSKSVALAGKVDVKSVVKIFIAKDTPGYSIVYDYEFPQRSSVFVEHLGTVPAKGSFRYISTDKQLEFRDGPGGDVLATVPLQETVIVAAKPPLMEVPDESQFPAAFRELIWDSSNSLHERANTVLGKFFRYDPRNDKGVVYLRTTFTPLPLGSVPDGVTAQVALLLSFIDRPEAGKYSFRIQSLVREGRTHSDEFRPTSNPAVIRSADLFVNTLIAEMKALEENKP
jgi:hypothetical protein